MGSIAPAKAGVVGAVHTLAVHQVKAQTGRLRVAATRMTEPNARDGFRRLPGSSLMNDATTLEAKLDRHPYVYANGPVR